MVRNISNPFFTMADTIAGNRLFDSRSAVQKATWLFGAALLAFVFAFSEINPDSASGWLLGSMVAALVFSMVSYLKSELAKYAAIPFALAEGVFVGVFTLIIEKSAPGIAFNAGALTLVSLAVLWVGYTRGWFSLSNKMKSFTMYALIAVGLTYLITIVGQLAFGATLPFIHESGLIGIGFSLAVVAVAFLSTLWTIQSIHELHGQTSSKAEWVVAIGLLADVVFMYVELAKLLAKIQDA